MSPWVVSRALALSAGGAVPVQGTPFPALTARECPWRDRGPRIAAAHRGRLEAVGRDASGRADSPLDCRVSECRSARWEPPGAALGRQSKLPVAAQDTRPD